jgi:hypothetical protein
VPRGAGGALFAVTTAGAVRLSPTGSPSAAVSLPASAGRAATSLVVLPVRDGSVSVLARAGTPVSLTLVAWI